MNDTVPLFLIGLTAFGLSAQAGSSTLLIGGNSCTVSVSDTEVAVKTAELSTGDVASVDSSATIDSGSYWTKISFSGTTDSASDICSSDSLGTTYISPVLIDSEGNDAFVNPAILLSFPAGTDSAVVSAYISAIPNMSSYSLISSPTLNSNGFTSTSTGAGYDIYKVTINTSNGYSILNSVSSMAANPGSAYTIAPDVTATAATDTNDTYYSSEWYLPAAAGVNAVNAWTTTKGSSTIRVAVFDTGVDNAHADLEIAGGTNVTPIGDEDEWYPTETYANHGTTVAGVIDATTNNGVGIASVAPNVEVYSVKIAYNCLSGGTFSTNASIVVAGIEWAAEQGCRVTNSSWSTTNATIAELADEAFENTRISNQMLHFASSGNGGASYTYISLLSNDDSVIAVGATNSSKSRCSFSQYGTGLDLVAPGASICTTDRTGSLGYTTSDYTVKNGTSYASPIAAACAALVLSKNPGLTADEVEDVLESTATDLGTSGWDKYYGYGLVNANAALNAVDPYVFFGIYDAGGAWKCDPTFGWINDIFFPVYWHAELGWEYACTDDPDDFMIYDYTAGEWFWTSVGEDGIFPCLYRYKNGTWYEYQRDTTSPRKFKNLSTNAIESF